MSPEVGPLPAFLFSWLLAGLLGALCLIWALRSAGVPGWKIAVVWVMNTAAIIIGSKLLFLFEAWLPGSSAHGSFSSLLLSPRMRVPGGILFAIFVGPWVARIVREPFLVLADLAVPAAAVCLVAIRIGCFLEGCCFGLVSNVPWAVRFPRSSEVFGWQLNEHLVSVTAPSALPVHPLQLYFAGAALLIAVALFMLQRRKRFDGELLLVFLVAYLWSTGLLEFMRARPHAVAHSVVLVGAVLTSLLALFVESRARAVPRQWHRASSS